jgi:Skp family chaperone for outer membrane proteins
LLICLLDECLFKVHILNIWRKIMKKLFIIAALALVIGSLSIPAKAAEDVLIVNLQYVVSQSKSGVALRKQSEDLNKEVVALRDEISKALQDKGKKLEEDKTLLAPEVFQERLVALQSEAESKQLELQTRVQKIQEAIQRASSSIDSVMSPILTEIVNEKGAKILLDRQAMLFGDPKLDISAEVVKKLNKRLPDVKVTIK